MLNLIKSLARWLRYKRGQGVTYHEYPEKQIESAEGFEHPLGCYKADGRCLGFMKPDGSIQFRF